VVYLLVSYMLSLVFPLRFRCLVRNVFESMFKAV
jgi:hypothetical protein